MACKHCNNRGYVIISTAKDNSMNRTLTVLTLKENMDLKRKNLK
jgi:hypothetical protein